MTIAINPTAKSKPVAKPAAKAKAKKAAPAPAKKAAPAPAAKAKPAFNDERLRLDNNAKITLKTKDNPCRVGSLVFKRYAKYRTGMTIADARAAGLHGGDFKRDLEKGRITIG